MIGQRQLAPDRSLLRFRWPHVRLPWWLLLVVLAGQLLMRALGALVWLLRHPRTTLGIAACFGVVYALRAYGPGWVVLVTFLLCLALGTWAWGDPRTFDRYVEHPLRARWRLFWVYRREWQPAMLTASLSLPSAMGQLLPELRKVRTDGRVDVVRVRMNPGQTLADWVTAAPRLAQTFGVRDVRPRLAGDHELDLWCIVDDPLNDDVQLAPADDGEPLGDLVVGRREDGGPATLRILHNHLLVGGETGSGKGSVLWSLLAGLGPGIRDGLVRVWAIDPKGGMELAAGAPLFDRFAYGGSTLGGGAWQEPIAALLEEAVRGMQQRAERLRGHTRKLTPTRADPLIVVVIDELASLTAYVTDPALRKRLHDALALLLSQGRAVGVSVVAATQDVRKEVVTMRDLFPTRVALRAAESAQADMVLGAGARARGARSDAISETTPGVGYIVLDDDPTPVRVRFSHVTDDHITELVDEYRPRPLVVA